MKVRVYHSYYGCETGCCGHRFEITLKDGTEHDRWLGFEHGDKAWAIEGAKEIVRNYWPECFDSIDWDTIEVDDVAEKCDW